MSIFRKASENENLPESVKNAFFDSNEMSFQDDFAGILKEASSTNNRSVYENRLKEFQKIQKESVPFEKPQPARYSDRYSSMEGGIRRAGYSEPFAEEVTNHDHLRSISYENQRNAENALNNNFSIWEPEFDDLQEAFRQSQSQDDVRFDRLSATEKQKISHNAWAYDQLQQIRKSQVLPYRGLTRIGNEQPINHDKLSSRNEFLADANDQIREMTRLSNRERKEGITRKGYDPQERLDQWQNKEAVEARTIGALHNGSSFLSEFADTISLSSRDE